MVKVSENSLVKQSNNKRIEPWTRKLSFFHRYTYYNNLWSVWTTNKTTRREMDTFSRCRAWLAISLQYIVSVTQEFALRFMTFALQPHFTDFGLHHIIPFYTPFSYFSVHYISKMFFSLSIFQAQTCDCASNFKSFWLDSAKDYWALFLPHPCLTGFCLTSLASLPVYSI